MKPVSRCFHPATSSLQRWQLRPAQGRTREEPYKEQTPRRPPPALPVSLTSAVWPRPQKHMNTLSEWPAGGTGETLKYPCKHKGMATVATVLVEHQRPQRRDHHSWGVGKDSGMVLTIKLPLGENTWRYRQPGLCNLRPSHRGLRHYLLCNLTHVESLVSNHPVVPSTYFLQACLCFYLLSLTAREL